MFDDLITDLRFAIRSFLRTPGQTAVLILTLAAGMGATTAIFSVLEGVLLAPLSYEDPHELVSLRHRYDVDGVGLQGVGGADLVDYENGAPSLESLGAVSILESNLNDDQGAARVTMGFTTTEFFQVLGTQAAMGRVLEPSDWAGAARANMEDPNFTPPPMAVLLSHSLWESRFGADVDILGRGIRVNGQSMNVIGVLPRDFRLHLPADAEVPADIDLFALIPVPPSDMGRAGGGQTAIARLRDGATIEQATAELQAVAAELRTVYPEHARLSTEVVVSALHLEVVRPARTFLWVLFGAAGLLLLIACANIANLLLVRASARETEFAVRTALGAGLGRLVRQLLAQGLVLSVAGAAAGLALATVALDLLVALRPPNLPRLETASLNGTVLLFALAVTVGVSTLFGLVPALGSGSGSPRALLSGRGVGRGGATLRLRRTLIVLEVALSLVLVAGTGLLLRSFAELRQVDLGFEPEGVVAMDIAVPFFGYRDDARRADFFLQIVERANELAGVEAAGMVPDLPLLPLDAGWRAPFAPVGEPLDAEGTPWAQFRSVSAGGLEALGATPVEGRLLDMADERAEGVLPVVVDRRFADAWWPEGALGQSFEGVVAAYTGSSSETEFRVVGVVEPLRFGSVAAADEPTIFVPYQARTPVDGSLVLRTAREPADIASDVRGIVTSLDPQVPVYSVRRVSDIVNLATADSRYALFLVGVFGATALLLAAVGLYGVISTLVQQRTREIGIRMAHGAEGQDILRLVLSEGLRVVVPGLLLGAVIALAAAPFLRSLLFGADPVDPVTLAAAAAVLGVIALAAGAAPARRASSVNPATALRDS